jgi:hypothetical protein
MPHEQNTEQDHNLKICNNSYENVTKVRYFGVILTNKNCVHEQCKRLNLENAYYHLVQNLLSSDLLSQNVKAKIYRTVLFLLLHVGVKVGESH